MAGHQTMGTLSTGQGLRLTATGRHQYRQGMEPPGSSRGQGVWRGVVWQEGGPVQGRNQKGLYIPEQGL